MQTLQSKPRLNFDQATQAAQSGSCACEYIGTLVHGIELVLAAIRDEERARLRSPQLAKVVCAPLSDGEDWNVMCSMLNLLRDQAQISADIFAQIEIATRDGANNG